MQLFNSCSKAVFVILIITISISPLYAQSDNKSKQDHNCAIVQRLFSEAYNQRNLNILNDIVAVDYVEQMNGFESEGVISIIKTVQWLEETAPDFQLKIEDMICKNDKVVVRWTYKGTNAQYDKIVKLDGMYIAQISDGKIIKGWQVFDNYQRFMQLGYFFTAPDDTLDVKE